MTPAAAIRAGVDYIVVGRPILEAKDPVVAARSIVADMQGRTAVTSNYSSQKTFRPR
jgi:orotidine-5'-phosphate decarboxylase